MNLSYVRLREDDGSWASLLSEWMQQCAGLDEDFDEFYPGRLELMRPLALGVDSDAGIFAVKQRDSISAVFQANVAALPKTTGKTLRIRHITLSPQYDFGDYGISDYGQLLIDIFTNSIFLSLDEMKAEHVKFHLPSAADQTFFSMLGARLDGTQAFEKVAMRGAWLYVTNARGSST